MCLIEIQVCLIHIYVTYYMALTISALISATYVTAKRWHGGFVVSIVASQQEVPGLIPMIQGMLY